MFVGALRGPLVNWRCRQCYVAEGKNLPEPVGVRQGCWLASAFLMTVPNGGSWPDSCQWPSDGCRPVEDGRASTKQTVSCGDGREAGEQTGTAPLLDHLIRALQQRWRDDDSERLRGLEVDDELEPRRLLHRNIGGFRALENLVHEAGCAAPMPCVG